VSVRFGNPLTVSGQKIDGDGCGIRIESSGESIYRLKHPVRAIVMSLAVEAARGCQAKLVVQGAPENRYPSLAVK
jgi:hypothetical protein